MSQILIFIRVLTSKVFSQDAHLLKLVFGTMMKSLEMISLEQHQSILKIDSLVLTGKTLKKNPSNFVKSIMKQVHKNKVSLFVG